MIDDHELRAVTTGRRADDRRPTRATPSGDLLAA
jgi:hypothetical protein